MSNDIRPDPRECLSALVDGERVDPDLLAEVLVSEEARRQLVDFVRLREAVDVAVGDIAPPALPALPRGRRSRMAAAVAVLAVVAVGLWVVSERMVGPTPTTEPRAFRVQDEQLPEPPRPDRVLHFEPGVDWIGPAGPAEGDAT